MKHILIFLLLWSVMTIFLKQPWRCTKWAVLHRSSAVSQSLVLRVVGSGQMCCRLVMMGQVVRCAPKLGLEGRRLGPNVLSTCHDGAGRLLCPKAWSWGSSARAKCAVDLSWWGRSSAVPQSLVLRVVGSGQMCCRLVMMGQVCSMCWCVWYAEPTTFANSCWVESLPSLLRCWWSLQCPVRSRYIWRLGLFSPAGRCCLSPLVSISRVSPLTGLYLFFVEEYFGFVEGHTGAGLLHDCLPLPDDPLFRCLVLQRGQGSSDLCSWVGVQDDYLIILF
jgi:hypothetical protein